MLQISFYLDTDYFCLPLHYGKQDGHHPYALHRTSLVFPNLMAAEVFLKENWVNYVKKPLKKAQNVHKTAYVSS